MSASPGAAARDIVLAAEGLVKRFGGLVAVDGVDLALERGTILGMIGINGARALFELL